MKPISARRLKDLPLRALKSYAHAQGKNAKRLRDEASRLGNKAATAERAEKRARAEIDVRSADMALRMVGFSAPASAEQAAAP